VDREWYDVGNADAKWVVPASGAQIDWYDATTFTYQTATFTVPTGYTAVISGGKVLRDNAVTNITLDQGATHTALVATGAFDGATYDAKTAFGSGASFPATPLQFASGSSFPAGTYTVTFTVNNEDLLGAPGVAGTNQGVAYPPVAPQTRVAANPTGILFCFDVVPTQIPVGTQGCSPGYYKKHTTTPALSSKTIFSVFGANSGYGVASTTTLQDALGFSGGSTIQDAKNNLIRQGAAGYANTLHLGNNYPLSQTDLINQVKAALATNDRAQILALAATLDGYNNLEGPNC